jgi:hypothetical protein
MGKSAFYSTKTTLLLFYVQKRDSPLSGCSLAAGRTPGDAGSVRKMEHYRFAGEPAFAAF